MKRERGIHELYGADPVLADELVFGRRRFLSSIGTMASLLGANIVFDRFMPGGLIPAALADSRETFQIPGKHPGLTVINDRPLNAETPPHLLDDAVTPADRLFVRNNGLPPETIDASAWQLEIGGEGIDAPRRFSIAELRLQFETRSFQLTIECGGNGRAEFTPSAPGNQWTTGAVGSPRWTGVRLADVLRACGLNDRAVYIGYYGADRHISGDPAKVPISRGVPMAKALEDESLIAWAINDQDLPLQNGYPLRLVFGGWPASTSGKWLKKIVVRDRVHDGPKMGGYSYRVPAEPVVPGADVPVEDMRIIEAMPVKSLVTFPKSGLVHPLAKALTIRGHAWVGAGDIARVEVSMDFGRSWKNAELLAPANRLAWTHWSTSLQFPSRGYYEIWARAEDSNGIRQPMVVPQWNPKGYLNNATHRIAVKVV